MVRALFICTMLLFSAALPAQSVRASITLPPDWPRLIPTEDGQRILAPFAHARFCRSHPDQCTRRNVSLRKPVVRLTTTRLAALERINRNINQAIRPQRDRSALGDVWTIAPRAGDCDDFVVTKRAHLLAAGWPSSALIMMLVRTRGGEAHLVLVVRTSAGDYVLDSLINRIVPIAAMTYQPEAVQSVRNARHWLAVHGRRGLPV